MADNDYTSSLIQTKIHRPPLPVDLVARPRLIEWLERRRERPLTLVSAPAGYGKSTLISCWLQSADCPSAWLSLDEHDNELGEFLRYFLAAIRPIFPGALPETQALLQATLLPPIHKIAQLLINEIDQLGEPFILVLDDYHLIDSEAIHELLKELLLHSPRNLHLVLGTRMDPFLPLVSLRADGRMTEVRSQDLRFDIEETLQLFQNMVEAPIDRATVIELDARAEGWVTGLRLAALAMRHRIGRAGFQDGLTIQNRYVTEYLLTEILAREASAQVDCLLRSSILERFCAGLIEAVCFGGAAADGEAGPADESGEQFLTWLQSANLFAIPLDDRREWFRYHQVFRDFLRGELASRLSVEEIARLHAAAGRWYADIGLVEEGIYHLLAGGDAAAAIALVAAHRYRMMNETQWLRLSRWLNLFPPALVETSPELLMLRTWLVYHRGHWAELPPLLEQLTLLMEQEQGELAYLTGEISALHGLMLYLAGDVEEALERCHLTLDVVPTGLWIVRVFARMILGVGLLMKGDVNGAFQVFYGDLEEEKGQNERFQATLLTTACFFHWMAGDLQSMSQAATRSIALCREQSQSFILGQSNYHLGCVHYQRNNLPEAEALFASVVARPYQNYGSCYVPSADGLVAVLQAQGKMEEARQVGEDAIAFLLETANSTFLPYVRAWQAEAALRSGHLAAASQWAKSLGPIPPLAPEPWFSSPALTLAKVWLAQNTPDYLRKADELLGQLQEHLEGIHNTRFLIEALALRATLEEARNKRSAALAALEAALRLAQPGGFIRVFVDLGPPMAVLLSRLRVDPNLAAYVGQVRSAFSEPPVAAPGQDDLLEPLTNRELEVLELLGDRLTNKEIAARLVITPGTVKGHTIQIYSKLHVNGRRQAVEKAIALGMLPAR